LALTAADLMTSPVLTITQDTSLAEAARLLSRSSFSGAPVVDTQGRCVGVISSSDFVTWAGTDEAGKEETISFIAPWGEIIRIEDNPDSEIGSYMTAQPVVLSPASPIGELAQTMVDAHIHRVLVVVEQDLPCGIVTSTDILAAVARAARRPSSTAKSKPTKRVKACPK
jgi:CBS domain-containing protein